MGLVTEALELFSKHVYVGSVGVIGLLFLFVCARIIYQAHLSGLSKIPGPWLARYTNLWAAYHTWKVDETGRKGETKPQFYRNLQAQFGDVIRTGPENVVVMDPEVVPLLYGFKARLNKGDAYVPFRQPGVTTSLLSIPDEATHSMYRKTVANAYAMASMTNYEPAIDQLIDRFTEVLGEHAESGEPINLTQWCYYFCFDTVTKITTGKAFGFMDGSGQDVFGLLGEVDGFGQYVGPVGQAPWLHYVLKDNFLLRQSKPSPYYKAIQAAVDKHLQDEKVGNGDRTSLLSHFAEAYTDKPELMTPRQMLIQAGGNLIAGVLSPGKTFETLFQWLAPNEEAQEKLLQEVCEDSAGFPAAFDGAQDLPYLNGIIREAERLHVTASFTLDRVVGPEGLDLPNGCHLPAGTQVGCNIECINSDKRVYGPDADEFKPERWMQSDGESDEAFEDRIREIETTNLTFGQGSRTCIGKNLFKLEAVKLIASLIVSFKFEPVERSTDDLYVVVHKRR